MTIVSIDFEAGNCKGVLDSWFWMTISASANRLHVRAGVVAYLATSESGYQFYPILPPGNRYCGDGKLQARGRFETGRTGLTTTHLIEFGGAERNKKPTGLRASWFFYGASVRRCGLDVFVQEVLTDVLQPKRGLSRRDCLDRILRPCR